MNAANGNVVHNIQVGDANNYLTKANILILYLNKSLHRDGEIERMNFHSIRSESDLILSDLKIFRRWNINSVLLMLCQFRFIFDYSNHCI